MNNSRVLSVFLILLSFAILLGVFIGTFFQVPYGNIAVIKIEGVISSSGSGLLTAGTTSTSIVEKINEIKFNPVIQAVIFDINSGGGSSVASAEVVRAIKELGKPTIALIREVGASGAYWVASACDYIVAHDLSFVGSIGVSMDYLEYSGLLNRFNVSYVNLSYPEHKDMFSEFRPLTDLERSWVQDWLEASYNYFINDVALNRNMTREELLPYANGSVFMGYQAIDYGLIDALGGWPEAYNKSIELGEVTEPILIEYGDGASILDLLKGITGQEKKELII